MPPALPSVQRDVNPMSPPAYSPASPPPTPPPPPPPSGPPPPYSATEPPRLPLPSHAEREERPTYTAVDFDPRSLTQGQISELTKMAGPITRLLRTELRLELADRQVARSPSLTPHHPVRHATPRKADPRWPPIETRAPPSSSPATPIDGESLG